MNHEQHWWQNTHSWTTREGVTIRLEDLTLTHRLNILQYVAGRSLRAVRNDMIRELMSRQASFDDALAEEELTFDAILDGPDDEILARMPLILRLRELNEQAEAERAQRDSAMQRESARRERKRRRTRRVAERTRAIDDIRALGLIAEEHADRHALTLIRDHLASVLTSSDSGVSQCGSVRATALVHDRAR